MLRLGLDNLLFLSEAMLPDLPVQVPPRDPEMLSCFSLGPALLQDLGQGRLGSAAL